MFGLGEFYIIPLAVHLKLSPTEIGVLSAMMGLAAALAQFASPALSRVGGRKKLIVRAVFLQALMCLPLGALTLARPHWPLMPYIGIILIGLATVYAVFGSIATPAWSSLIGQYIPANTRGRYFSWRQRLTGFITLLSTFAGAAIIQFLPAGYFIVFTLASASRFASDWSLTKHYEPSCRSDAGFYRNIVHTFKDPASRNFTRFAVFISALTFAVNVATPFFAVYMLRDLAFSTVTYTLITVTSTFVTLLAMPAWGRHADKLGNVQIIKLSSLLMCILPALWLVSPNKPYLFFIQIVGGFAWSGFNIAVNNFIYDASPERQRLGNFAFFNLLNGMGICLGSLAGGIILPHLPLIFKYQVLTVFALSTVLRFTVVAMLSGVNEVKQVDTVGKLPLLLSLAGIRPLKSPRC